MTIDFNLQPFKIAEDEEESYRAAVKYRGTIDLEGVVDRMNERVSTTPKEDMIADFNNISATIKRLVLDGWRVVTPSANFGASIKGTFSRTTDPFDATQHQVVPTASPGAALRRDFSQMAQVQKVSAGTLRAPNPLELTNWNNGDGNDTLTSGGLHTLNGELLKYDQSDPEQGIFIIPQNGGGLLDPDQAVRVEIVNRNTPQEISFLAPSDLAPGEYTLEVRSDLGQNTLRTGKYNKTLTVV